MRWSASSSPMLARTMPSPIPFWMPRLLAGVQVGDRVHNHVGGAVEVQAVGVAKRRGVLEHVYLLGQGDRGPQIALELERQHAAEVRHLPQRRRVVRMAGQTGIDYTAETFRCVSRNSATLAAFRQWRAIRSGSVTRPRLMSQTLNGLSAPPRCTSISLRMRWMPACGPSTAPPSASPCPLRYLVRLWMT